LNLLIQEAGINTSAYVIDHLNKTFDGLSDEGDIIAYSRQAHYVVSEKIECGDTKETPLILTLSVVADFICRSIGLGGKCSYSEILYKLFNLDGELPQSFFTIWAALMIATESDFEFYENYQVSLFKLKSGNQTAPLPETFTQIAPAPTLLEQPKPPESPPPILFEQPPVILPEPPPRTPSESKEFEFDFSNFKT